MAVGRSRQGTNQEGALAPLVSPWGQYLKAHTADLIAHPPPIGSQSSRRATGTVGGIVMIQASIKPLVMDGGYFGDAPQSLQATIRAAEPWERV